eukprot:COSAG02_NODE_326_length_24603_cov_123.455681_13_plen_387_part_00
MSGVQFHLLRCGTSRGPFFWASALPSTVTVRDALLCAVMGSGSPGQIDGIGGGTAVTSKAVFVARTPADDPHADVEYNFAQVEVRDRRVNHSHGDCLNMLAGVIPFVLADTAADEVCSDRPRGISATWPLRIRSMETGLLAEQWIASGEGDPQTFCRKGQPITVMTRMVGCAGAMTGSVLPSGNPTVTLKDGLRVSVVDFSRVMVIVDAGEVGVGVGTNMNDPVLCARLETIRLAAAQAAGMGDCSHSDSPKLCVVAAAVDPDVSTSRARLRAWYWVNPGRCDAHPSLAITGASCLAVACEIPGTVPHALCGGIDASWLPVDGAKNSPTSGAAKEHLQSTVYTFDHSLGSRSVTLWRQSEADPDGVSYSNSVRILASGELYVDGDH